MTVTFPHRYLFIPVSDAVVQEKKKRKVCVSFRCRRKARDDRFRCHTCESRLRRLGDPLYYAFQNLKSSARKRGIQFLLTRDEFADFCKKYGYLEKKGKEPASLTVDRWPDTRGPYSKDNIRPLGYADNCSHKFENKPAPEPTSEEPFDESNPFG